MISDYSETRNNHRGNSVSFSCNKFMQSQFVELLTKVIKKYYYVIKVSVN